MDPVSKYSPFESQIQTQPKSNTEAEMKESKSDEEEKGSFSSDEKKKGKQPMKEKKQKQKYRNINEMMYGPGGKPKGVVIGDRVFADEYDSDKPPASKRMRHGNTEVKSSSYSLRSENKDSEEKEPKGKEKEEEIEQKGKNIAEGSDGENDSFSLEPEMNEIYIQLEELSW